MLDWTEHPRFLPQVLDLVRPVDAKITHASSWMPLGYSDPEEARLETFGPAALPGHPVWAVLPDWWLAHQKGANTPNWDLVLSCEVSGRPGLILVEAKAHDRELSEAGKYEASDASQRSAENRERIRSALAEATTGYSRCGFRPRLAADSHYQLANRLAFSWKLASSGIPTVLVYLGFTGDASISDVGTPFNSEKDWDDHCRSHLRAISAADMLEREIPVGEASLWIQIRSRAANPTELPLGPCPHGPVG